MTTVNESRPYTPEELKFAGYLSGLMSSSTGGLHKEVLIAILEGENLQKLAEVCYQYRNQPRQFGPPQGYGISTYTAESPIKNSLDGYLSHIQEIIEKNCHFYDIPAPARSCLWRS